ncbi:MAG: GcvT family protein [Hyphomicrobiales bacterium]
MIIIGGGAMGVSLLYHLTKRGWTDAVLVEKNELTAGSTWHAAGLCTHFAHNPTIMELRATSVRLYRDTLPEETGQGTGFHACGALRVTRSQDRMDEFRHVQGIGRFTGYDFNILTPEELKEIYPLCRSDGLIGAIHEPDDGHVDPTLATNAMAAGARSRGAEIYRHTKVTEIGRTASGEWLVTIDKGEIRAQHLVNAAGTWCREIGDMMNIDLPVVPILHQYVVTDRVGPIAERIAAGAPELPMIRDPEESWYLRQERDGYIVGPYEKSAQPWSIDGVPPEFGMELLPSDLDRIEPIVALAMERVPALAEAGIKTIVNGPITFTPDGNPLVGPAFALENAWLLTGSSMGVMEGGGAGKFLADWMVDGAPPSDALAIDARRFGGYADRAYRLDKAIECFGLQFGVHYPFEERSAGREQRVTPVYERQAEAGAVFGAAYGWERPNWYAAGPGKEAPPLTFRRPGWFKAVAEECRAVSQSVGLGDLSAFSKFEVTGAGALDFLETFGSNPPPRRDGRIGLTHALTSAGGTASEFTVTRLAIDRFYLTSAAAAERHDEDLLRVRSATRTDVAITNVTERIGILALMGPGARSVLEKVTDADLGNDAFPWLSAVELTIAGVATRALRVSYVGELGWELHAPLDQLAAVQDALMEAGRRFDIHPFGAYAMNAMRLEKGYRAWGMDLTTERTPLEAGLAHLVRTENRDFAGRTALLARAARADAWRMALLDLEHDGTFDPFYLHAMFKDGAPVGIVTSGAFGHRTGKALALAYLTDEVGPEERAFSVEILGTRFAVTELERPPYDPDNARLRDTSKATRPLKERA